MPLGAREGDTKFWAKEWRQRNGDAETFCLHSFAAIPLPNPFWRLGHRFRLATARWSGRCRRWRAAHPCVETAQPGANALGGRLGNVGRRSSLRDRTLRPFQSLRCSVFTPYATRARSFRQEHRTPQRLERTQRERWNDCAGDFFPPFSHLLSGTFSGCRSASSRRRLRRLTNHESRITNHSPRLTATPAPAPAPSR